MRTLLPVFAALATAATAAEPLVVVGPQNLGASDLSRQQVSRIFLGLTGDVGGRRVTPVVVADKSQRAELIGHAVGREPGAVEQHFVKQELRGEGRWPTLVADARQAARRIVESANIQGRPAVLACMLLSDFEALTEAQRTHLTVLTVEGKKPGEPGYALTNGK